MSEPLFDNVDSYLSMRVPHTLSPNLMDLSTTDKLVLIPLSCTSIIVALTFGNKMVGLGVFIFSLILMYRINFGRVITVCSENIFADTWIKLVQREVLWKADKARRAVLGRSNALRLHVTNIGGWLGVVHIEGTNTDAIIISGSGSDISSKGIRTMHARNLELAEACKKVASQNGFRIGTSFLYRRRPADPYREMDMYGSNCMPAIFEAGEKLAEEGDSNDRELTPDENKALLMEQLIGAACEGDGNISEVAVFTIEREPTVQQAAKGRKPALLKLDRLTAMQVARTARDNLKHVGVSEATILDYRLIEDHLRLGWDVFDLVDYFIQAPDVDGDGDTDEDSESPEVTTMEMHWPAKVIKRSRKYCQFDGTYHSVLLITEQPQEVIANTYFQLHTIEVPYLSIAAPGQAFKITREKQFYKRFIPIAETAVEQSGIRLDPTQQKRLEEQKQRERELHGSRLSLAYNILVDVAASSLEELEDRVADTERQLRLRGFEPKRVTGRTRQIPAMLSATTGIPML